MLFKTHPCSRGLSEPACREIADAAEVVILQPADFVNRRDQPATSVFLIVHGRLKQEVFDVQGKVIMTRYQKAGGQYGGISAAVGEPMPVDCVAEDPSTLLRFDYLKCQE